MIIGIGIDITEVSRFEKTTTSSEDFIKKIFTKKEIAYCCKHKQKAIHYAARFAIKEAFMKALGTGWRFNLTFCEIETINDKLGKPTIKLSGTAKTMASKKRIKNIHASISHTESTAIAVVILEK